MVEIFVCEDDEIQRKQLKEYIEDYIKSEDVDGNKIIEMELKVSTGNPQEIIDYVQKNNVRGLYFLDVDLNAKLTGIELAKEIRAYDKKGEIIFITTHGEMMPLTFEYKLKALDYIVKDQVLDMEKRVIECINLANEHRYTWSDEKTFYLKSGRRIISEAYHNIMFFKKVKGKHYVSMCTRNGFREFRGNLNEIEAMDSCLCRCSQEFVVNVNNVVAFDRKKREVRMVNGAICYVSIRSIKGLTEALDKRTAHFIW